MRPHDPSFEGTTEIRAIRILRCVRRRNGTIDYDVVFARITSYGGLSLLAVALGALIGFAIP
jgi:hypothetical protein